jgi:hypothetical protein
VSDDAADPMRDALEALLDAAGEARAREILAEVGRPAACAQLERLAALRLAHRLRQERAPRVLIRERLERLGHSRATAYRLIEEAISAPIAICLKPAGALRRDDDTLATESKELQVPAQPTEINLAQLVPQLKTLVVERYQAALDRHRHALDALDVDGAERAARAAEEDYERIRRMGRDDLPASEWLVVGGADTPHQKRIQSADLLRRARRKTANEARAAHPVLKAKVAELERLVSCERRVTNGRERIAAARDAVKTAADAVVASEAAIATIAGLIDAEERAIAGARESAAANLLAAVKAGSGGYIAGVSRDKLETLLQAKKRAEAELEQSKAAQAQARNQQAAAEAALRVDEQLVRRIANETAAAAARQVDAQVQSMLAAVTES